jgi:hypothetical protein
MLDLNLFEFVPVFPDTQDHPAKLCVIVRQTPDPVAGWFVPVRHTMDAAVYLGALCDAEKRPRRWVEIWVQSIGSHGGRKPDPLHNNASLDQRWRRWAGALLDENPECIHAGPWQETHPLPTYFKPDAREMVHPAHPDEGRAWQLCTDDFVLRKAGLPGYSGTTQRLLHIPGGAQESVFVSADPGAAPIPRTRPPGKELGFDPSWIPFNPEGGLMLFRTFEAYSLRQFKAILEGHRLDAVNLEADGLLHPEVAPTLRTTGYLENGHGLLFAGRRGRAGRALEVFLLKTLLFAEVVERVARAAKAGGAPFLNLHASDVRVDLQSESRRLPACWSFRTAVTRSPESLPVEIAVGGYRMFQPVGPVVGSEYRPKILSAAYSGLGTVRIRDVRTDPGDALVAEGTLADIEARRASRHDLLRLVLPVRGQGLVVHARILSDQQMASDELRFETLPQSARTDLKDSLMAIRGAPLESVSYQFQPVASSPCDLYSCAILGLEILIDPSRVRLPLAVDEFLSFVRQLGLEKAEMPLSTRRGRVLSAEPRFSKSLGPQNLGGSQSPSAEDPSLIPAELWWSYVEILARMIPGGMPDSWARDFGDVNPAALESCFKAPLEELAQLSERIRSVAFSDWPQNQEVIRILDQLAL